MNGNAAATPCPPLASVCFVLILCYFQLGGMSPSTTVQGFYARVDLFFSKFRVMAGVKVEG